MDVFTWSMPFLAEKVVSMLYTIVKKGCDDEDGVESEDIKGILDKMSRNLLFILFMK